VISSDGRETDKRRDKGRDQGTVCSEAFVADFIATFIGCPNERRHAAGSRELP
jgi:hypothetical protein